MAIPSRLPAIFNQPQKKRFLTGINPTPPPYGGEIMRPLAPPGTAPNVRGPELGSNDSGDYFDEFQRIFQNKGPALSRYQEALQEQPVRADYAPSWKRRLGAALVGGLTRDPNAAVSMIESPYRNAMEDYGVKVRGLGESARIESEQAEDQLRALSTARALGLKIDEFKQKQLEASQDYDLKKRTYDLNRDKFELDTRDVTSQIETRGRTAGAAERQADAAARRARSQERATESLISYRGEMAGISRKRVEAYAKRVAGAKSNPTQQAYAVDNALRELHRDPVTRDFVTITSQGNYDFEEVDRRTANSPAYKDFERRLRQLVNNQLGESGSPFEDEEDIGEDDDEFVVDGVVD